MLFKIAYRNTLRNIKDYLIYFVTITLAVCLFYVFNSIQDQQIILNLDNSQKEILEILSKLLITVSIVVAVVFAFLSIYSNQFILKRRKKEFGIYKTLGMNQYKISIILVFEVLFIGIASLIVGLTLGYFMSQFMGIITANLFDVDITKYKFVFSMSSFIKTIAFFFLIFTIVTIVNIIMISKQNIINLLKASKTTSDIKQTNKLYIKLAFIFSAIFLIVGTIITSVTKFNFLNPLTFVGIILIVISLIGLSYSFLNNYLLFKRANKSYYKNINSFTNRQLSSKSRSLFLTIFITSLLLLCTITIFTVSISYKTQLDTEVNKASPYDASIRTVASYQTDQTDEYIVDVLTNNGVKFEMFKDYSIYEIINIQTSPKFILDKYITKDLEKDITNISNTTQILRYSDYVELTRLLNIDTKPLINNEAIVLSNMNIAQNTIKNYVKNEKKAILDIFGKNFKYDINPNSYTNISIYNENISRVLLCYVIADENVEEIKTYLDTQTFKPRRDYAINFIYNKDDYKEIDKYMKFLIDEKIDFSDLSGLTKSQAKFIVAGETTIYIFIAMYLGIVFLITSGAFISIKSITDATDEKTRYLTISRIGVSKKSINISIFKQLLTIYLLPFIFSIIFSYLFIFLITNNLIIIKLSTVISIASIATLVILLFYLMYLYISYITSVYIIKKHITI
ncbi:MAG: ABC transporter permease [Anaeroplasmataceae bacterium]